MHSPNIFDTNENMWDLGSPANNPTTPNIFDTNENMWDLGSPANSPEKKTPKGPLGARGRETFKLTHKTFRFSSTGPYRTCFPAPYSKTICLIPAKIRSSP